LQLRFLQTLAEIATEKNSTIVFPVPIDLLNLITHDMRERGEGGGDGTRPRVRVAGSGTAIPAEPSAPAPEVEPLPDPPTREGTVS
ncbi:MAG: slipin family protein, partial [Dehalococcoidia bacterium]